MSSFALKLIAIVTMTIDHLGAVLYWFPEYREMAQFMRMIGRIAFPIYAFLIAVGMYKSKKREMYLLRMLVFALISFVPFSLFVNVNMYGLHAGTSTNTIGVTAGPPLFDTSHTNVFFTLFLGAAAIYIFDWIKNNIKNVGGYLLGIAAAVGCAFLARLMRTDYGYDEEMIKFLNNGVMLIFVTYFIMSVKDNLFLRVIPLFIWVILQYGWGNGYMAFAMTSPLLILLYDGSPGSEKWRGKFKLAFYMYYPMHMVALYIFAILLR